MWRGSAAATCCLNEELSNTASTLCGAPPALATAPSPPRVATCWPVMRSPSGRRRRGTRSCGCTRPQGRGAPPSGACCRWWSALWRFHERRQLPTSGGLVLAHQRLQLLLGALGLAGVLLGLHRVGEVVGEDDLGELVLDRRRRVGDGVRPEATQRLAVGVGARGRRRDAALDVLAARTRGRRR